jgi:N-acetylneuraminate synthase/N,N'-diacetyllegionaminate synthase
MTNHTLIIAEAGVNHNGDINLAKKLIDYASEAKADIVKFQTFKAEKLVSKIAKKAEYQKLTTEKSDEFQFSMLKKLELSKEDHIELKKYAEGKNIDFLSTAFDLESIDLLVDLGITLFKIPSGEITNLPFLEKVARVAKKVIISTGMCEMTEIIEAVKVMKKHGLSNNDIIILHCNTEYPTPMGDVNLLAMQSIKDATDLVVGYSDHTLGIEIPIAAVALGAQVIEKHFTYDRNADGPDHKASLEPNELKMMVQTIRNIEMALGNKNKIISESEKKNISIARKSIHILEPIKKGEILELKKLVMLRPGDGISPMRLPEIIKKKAVRDLDSGHMLKIEDFQ